jgi:hypothetical protein
MSAEIEDLGEMLVSIAVSDENAAELTDQLREIHNEFTRNRDAEHGYFRMGFLAAKAIERCRRLEGSDGGVRAGDDGDPASESARAQAAQASHRPAESPGGPPPRSA